MEPLALLCNLHADGPATLQRLRRAGFESIVALGRLDPAGLAECLGWTERAAERFLREAVLLRERVERDEDDEGGEAETEFELESQLLTELDGELDEEDAEEEENEDELQEAELAESASSDASVFAAAPVERVAAVLGAWRELDRVAPPSDPAEFVIPRPAPPADLALTATGLAELRGPLAARLTELGVTSVRQLLARPELELARAIPLGFTRLRHLCLQARGVLEQLEARATIAVPAALAAEPRASFRTFVPPPSEPFETAGPFA